MRYQFDTIRLFLPLSEIELRPAPGHGGGKPLEDSLLEQLRTISLEGGIINEP